MARPISHGSCAMVKTLYVKPSSPSIGTLSNSYRISCVRSFDHGAYDMEHLKSPTSCSLPPRADSKRTRTSKKPVERIPPTKSRPLGASSHSTSMELGPKNHMVCHLGPRSTIALSFGECSRSIICFWHPGRFDLKIFPSRTHF